MTRRMLIAGWHAYGVRATGSMMERMEKTMKENMKTFTKKTVKRIGMKDIRIRRQNLILAWIDPRRCIDQNKQRKEQRPTTQALR
jgi:hypothetical protein